MSQRNYLRVLEINKADLFFSSEKQIFKSHVSHFIIFL